MLCSAKHVCISTYWEQLGGRLALTAWRTAGRSCHSVYCRPALAAVQVKDSRDLPWAIVGTVGVSTCLYILLALSLALMVYDGIACPNWVFFLAGNSGSVQERVSFLSAFVSGHCEHVGGAGISAGRHG